jgi:hypothetical protein
MRTLACLLLTALACSAQPKTRNIVFVMADGLRHQEIFAGADGELMSKKPGGVADLPALQAKYWRDTPEARRAALMPFLWGTVAKQGQLYGNRGAGSEAYVTNGMNFSYPGYSETLCGWGDPRVDSNNKVPNPNLNVLEWLNKQPAYAGKVAAFGAWELFPWILNAERSRLFVNAGYTPLEPASPTVKLLNRLKVETGIWGGEPLDDPMFLTALEYLKANKPRVLFVSFGETDEWAHDARYDLYLESANRYDRALQELWDTLQSMPEYRGSTTLIMSTDHGRGLAPLDWKGHGQKIPDSKYIWMGFLGPDTPALGSREKIPAVTEGQIAATLAALLGGDFPASQPKAAKPIKDVLGR